MFEPAQPRQSTRESSRKLQTLSTAKFCGKIFGMKHIHNLKYSKTGSLSVNKGILVQKKRAEVLGREFLWKFLRRRFKWVCNDSAI